MATNASVNAAASASQYGAPNAPNAGVSQWCTAGLLTAPNANVHPVMPSWQPASSTVNSRELRNAARADLLDDAASSRRCRFAPSVANSTATKNALKTMINTVAATTTHGLLIGSPPVRSRRPDPNPCGAATEAATAHAGRPPTPRCATRAAAEARPTPTPTAYAATR